MKFLTLDIYNLEEEDDRQLRAAYKRYTAHVETFKQTHPHLYELTQLQGVDDGLVVRVEHQRSRGVLWLTLRCGDLQMGYYDLILRYEDAEISAVDEKNLANIARKTRNFRHFKHDVCFHEVEPLGDGRVEHRILFHPGVWFAIRCAALDWERADQPNQELPELQNRFVVS